MLDEDKIEVVDDLSGDAVGDALPDYPPDRPLGVNTVGVTPVEEDAGESFAERSWREVSDVGTGPEVPPDEVGQLVEPDASTLDDEPQQVGEAAPGEQAGPEESAMHLEEPVDE